MILEAGAKLSRGTWRDANGLSLVYEWQKRIDLCDMGRTLVPRHGNISLPSMNAENMFMTLCSGSPPTCSSMPFVLPCMLQVVMCVCDQAKHKLRSSEMRKATHLWGILRRRFRCLCMGYVLKSVMLNHSSFVRGHIIPYYDTCLGCHRVRFVRTGLH